MPRIITYSVFMYFMSVASLLAQQYSEGSPEWLVDMFFIKESFLEKSYYYTDEMINDLEQSTIGEELTDSDAQIFFYKIQDKDSVKTFAIELELERRVIDFYCYIINENDTWKIGSIRRFLLPAFIYSVKDSISRLNSVSAADNSLLKTLELFTMNDSQLKNYLGNHVDEMSNLVWYFNQNENKEVDRLLNLLGFNAVYKDNRYTNCVFIQINLFQRMEAGFIYAAGSSSIPQISAAEFIYVEQVLPGWYIYRIM